LIILLITFLPSIVFATLFDSCDSLTSSSGIWSTEVAGKLSLNTTHKIEGSASIQAYVPSTAWDAYIFKRPPDPNRWDLSNESVIRFRIYPVGWVPLIDFGLTTREPTGWDWNGHEYGNLDLSPNQWNTVTIDLRTESTGKSVSNEALKMSGQILFVPKVYYQRSFTFYVDFIETLEGTYIHPQINITPTEANLMTNQLQFFSANTYYGKPPWTVKWYLNDKLVATGSNYTFSSNIVGNYLLYANVTDGVGQVAKSNVVNITVRSGGFLEIHAYANSKEIPAIVEIFGIGKYITPKTLILDTGEYTLNAKFGFQENITKVNVSEGKTTRISFQFEPRSIRPTYPLHVEGRYFKNSLGEIVFLRGVLRDGFLSSCTGFWQPEGGSPTSGWSTWDEVAVRAHMQQLKDYGMNVMRWPLNIEWWIKDMNTSLDGSPTNRHYRESVKDAIEIAQEYGIYIILNFYSVRLPGEQPKGPYPPYSNPGDEEVIPNRSAFVNFWKEFAREMKDYPNVIYEVFNEPVGMPASEWFEVIQEVINAIRSIGDNHIILVQYGYCGGFQINEFLSLNDPTGNVGYANHIYRHPPGATMGSGIPAYTYDDVKKRLTEGWNGVIINYDEAIDAKIPIVITELGPWTVESWNQTQEFIYYQNILQILNEWDISYTGSHWDNPWVYFRLQNFSETTAPFLLNEYGELLIVAVEEGGIYAINFTGELRDKNNNLVKTNISLLKEEKLVYNLTNIDGIYSLIIKPSFYDVLFNVSNFFVKLNLVNLTSNKYNKLTHLTFYPEKTSLTFDVNNNQTVQVYSPEKPRRVLKNSTALKEYNSTSDLITNYGWFYNETEKILYIKFNHRL